MMMLKEKITRTEVIKATYKGKRFETVPVPDTIYCTDMPSLSCITSIELPRHVFATKNGDINVSLENAPADLQKGQNYDIKIKKIFGITTSKIVMS
jgi:hypothetical protein